MTTLSTEFHALLLLGMVVQCNCEFSLLSSLCRLVCESTVEENILKKANQKRLLGNIAIEGGSFTTDFFKQVLQLYNDSDFLPGL